MKGTIAVPSFSIKEYPLGFILSKNIYHFPKLNLKCTILVTPFLWGYFILKQTVLACWQNLYQLLPWLNQWKLSVNVPQWRILERDKQGTTLMDAVTNPSGLPPKCCLYLNTFWFDFT